MKPLKEDVEEARKMADVDAKSPNTNPINNFKLVKRLSWDWMNAIDVVTNDSTSEDANSVGNIRQWLDTYNMYTPGERLVLYVKGLPT